jgi:hypothetical protein
MEFRKLARGLGWFSIGLGMTELMFGKYLGRALGLEHRSGLLRIFGLREIATGIGILTQEKKSPWIWARVAGDALDLGVLGAAALSRMNQKRGAAAVAVGNVAAVTALDVVTGVRLGLAR